MTTDESRGYGWDNPVQRPDGVTESERYLKLLCDRSFLSLWSHAGIYRDQGIVGRGDGKEVCDLLVVFENHVIFFSDKDCKYPETGDQALDWCRWYRRAIEKSAEQVYGAERWIKQHPDRLFLDRACTRRFPIELPPLHRAKFHRVIVAHDASRRCRQELGGSGSLMVIPAIVGEAHSNRNGQHLTPFAIGQVDPVRGYVHVFDDTTLDVVMKARDTITDFVEYLSKKEAFIESGRLISAAGEDDLPAYYLRQADANDEHDFLIPHGHGHLVINEGEWESFTRAPQRKAQLEADAISYLWDDLIERFTQHFINRTAYYCTHSSYSEHEKLLRIFARESRFRRRLLARAFRDIIERGTANDRMTRIIPPVTADEPYIVLLTLMKPDSVKDDDYRRVRREMLHALCKVTKYMYPDVMEIGGIATEPGLSNPLRSEDGEYFDARVWTAEDDANARELQDKWGFLKNLTEIRYRDSEYPAGPPSPTRYHVAHSGRVPTSLRNSPCPCGSGRKYKRCCGR